jgi:hypothetical protein
MSKSKRPKPGRTVEGLDEKINIRCPSKEKDSFLEAARGCGLTLSQWMRLAAWQIVDQHGGKVKLRQLD